MIQERLNDAAKALYKVLSEAGVKHGIFGGCAIGALGGPRESKDIDCITSVSKQQILSILNGKQGFEYLNQAREDYVAFFWSDRPDKTRALLLEILSRIFQVHFCLLHGLSQKPPALAHTLQARDSRCRPFSQPIDKLPVK